MTQIPFDQLAKQYLEEFLEPLGTVERTREVPGESKFVDVWFIPKPPGTEPYLPDLGVLGRMVTSQCLLEPFRNAPTRTEVRSCLLKLIWLQEDERRKAKAGQRPLAEADLPRLWILAAATSQPVIRDFKGEVTPGWLPGIYFLGEGLKTAIVAISELPEIEDTLWLRILGRGPTQERAIQAVLALPPSHPRRDSILRLLASWHVKIQVDEIVDVAEQEALMALSQAFLAWEQATEAKGRQEGRQEGERALILRLLSRRLGQVAEADQARITSLSLEQLENLGEALLSFEAIADLTAWLEHHGS